jgi:bone morphogenetic protein 2/4
MQKQTCDPEALHHVDRVTMGSRVLRIVEYNKSKKISDSGPCQRHSFYLDFENIGWNDWVIAPRGYDAYYCAGKCPENVNASTNQNVAQTANNSKSACCVPTGTDSLPILYLSKNGSRIALKFFGDMVVAGCGCR